jgi:Peptidase family S41
VFSNAHDGHFYWLPDSVFDIIRFTRPMPLVSLSSDGQEEPSVFAYADVLLAAKDSTFKPSPVVEIDGQEAEGYLQAFSSASISHDPDALWNDMFYDLSQIAQGGAGTATGGFSCSSFFSASYPGPQTKVTFDNGTTVTIQNKARKFVDFTGVTSGADLYNKFLTPTPAKEKQMKDKLSKLGKATGKEAGRSAAANNLVGYPKPILQDSSHTVNGFYLDGAEYKDVAVLTVTSFEPTDLLEFQNVLSKFIAQAKADGKTKLVIDLSSNPGGYIILGYELFRQLFPTIEPYGGSRYREHQAFRDISHVFNSATTNYSRADSDPNDVQWMESSAYSVSQDLDLEEKRFKSWKQKYGPYKHQNDEFSSGIRWNLTDVWNDGGFVITGYGTRSNYTQPFAAEDILLLQNGDCASTCTIFSEMMRQQAKVKTVMFGGRPSNYGVAQGVGQVKGAQAYGLMNIYKDTLLTFQYATPDQNKQMADSPITQYQSTLPFTRTSIGGGVNYKDGLREGDEGQTPLQFYYEPADCRMYYTADMTVDVSAIWKAASGSKWIDGNECVAGDYDASSRKRNAVKRNKTKTSTISVQQVPAERLDALYQSLNLETDLEAYVNSGGTITLF